MKLSKEVFKTNVKELVNKIDRFIGEKAKTFNKDGIVVPVSGGLDSSVILALCVKAIGKDKVIALMLPEKEGNPEAEIYSKKIIKFLKVKSEEIEITKVLEDFGTYKFALSKIPSRFLKKTFVKGFLKFSRKNPFLEEIKGNANNIIKKGMANFYIKNRVRFLFAYKFAEENNLLLVGSAHKSEDLVGLFVKFGVDDLADIMPLKNLYRTQIIEIAKLLKIPREIINRRPNPDIIPGIEDKYKDLLGLSAEKLDLILYGLENRMNPKNIAKQLGLKEDKIKEIKDLIKSTFHMRNHSLFP